MRETVAYFRILDSISKTIDRLPPRIAAEGVKFSKQRFREQAWVDNTTEPWKKRKVNKGSRQRQKRGILIDKARLFRSIRKITANAAYVEIGSVGVPYAEVHNNGGRFRINQTVRAHTRRGHTRNRDGRREQVESHSVGSFKRTLNINMPRRRFIGPSAVLNHRVERLITADIVTAIKNA